MLSGSVEHLGKSVQRSVRDLTSTSTMQRQRTGKHAEEIALWSHVLRLSVMDAVCASPVNNRDSREKLQDHALLWILDEGVSAGSFKWVCGILALCPLAVREEIMSELHRSKVDKGKQMGVRLKYWTRN